MGETTHITGPGTFPRDLSWLACHERTEGCPSWQVSGLTWDQARAALNDELADFAAAQDCPHCFGQAQYALGKLARLSPFEAFREDVDGADYVLARKPAPAEAQVAHLRPGSHLRWGPEHTGTGHTS